MYFNVVCMFSAAPRQFVEMASLFALADPAEKFRLNASQAGFLEQILTGYQQVSTGTLTVLNRKQTGLNRY